MRSMLAVVYLIWVGWMIRKTEVDEKALKWALGRFDYLAARGARVALAERVRLTAIDPARVEERGSISGGE